MFINLAANNAPAAISSLHETIAVGLFVWLMSVLAPSTPDSNEYSPSIIKLGSIVMSYWVSAAL